MTEQEAITAFTEYIKICIDAEGVWPSQMVAYKDDDKDDMFSLMEDSPQAMQVVQDHSIILDVVPEKFRWLLLFTNDQFHFSSSNDVNGSEGLPIDSTQMGLRPISTSRFTPKSVVVG